MSTLEPAEADLRAEVLSHMPVPSLFPEPHLKAGFSDGWMTGWLAGWMGGQLHKAQLVSFTCYVGQERLKLIPGLVHVL